MTKIQAKNRAELRPANTSRTLSAEIEQPKRSYKDVKNRAELRKQQSIAMLERIPEPPLPPLPPLNLYLYRDYRAPSPVDVTLEASLPLAHPCTQDDRSFTSVSSESDCSVQVTYRSDDSESTARDTLPLPLWTQKSLVEPKKPIDITLPLKKSLKRP